MSDYSSKASLRSSGSSTSSISSHMNYPGSLYSQPSAKHNPYGQTMLKGSSMANQNVRGPSCYTLTPASSTSSLADFANSSYMHAPADMMNMSLNMTAVSMASEASCQPQKKPTRSRTTKTIVSSASATNQARSSNSSMTSSYSTSSLPSLPLASSAESNQSQDDTLVAPEPAAPATDTIKRKRGRPPKQLNRVQVQDQPQQQIASLIPNPVLNANIIPTNITAVSLSSVIESRATRAMLMKTLPTANLQRNKSSSGASTSADSDTKPKMTSLIAMYYTQEDETTTPSTPMPNITWAKGDDVWRAMRKNELKYVHDANYLSRHSGILPHMRGILLDWVVELCHAYRLHRETFHLSVEYMDRYLSLTPTELRMDRLQLLGMTCLFLAAKVEEIYPPKLHDLAAHMEGYSNNNEEAVSQFELAILETFQWKISPVTANVWLQVYLQIAAHNPHVAACFYAQGADNSNQSEVNYSRTCILKSDDYNQSIKSQTQTTTFVLPMNIYKNQPHRQGTGYAFSPKQEKFYLQSYMKAVTLLDLCTFDINSLKFKYSVLAASAMFLMLNSTSRISDVELTAKIVQDCTGYKMSELESCVQWMHAYADVCKEVLTVERMICIRKFQTVDDEDAHNIQLFHKNLELLVGFYLNPNTNI
jgi:hypothetical protein